MATLMIGYDLNRPGQDYAALIERIKSHGRWWHHLDSTWFVVTSLTPNEMCEELRRYIDSSDELLVLDVTRDSWWGVGFEQRAYDWLKENLPG
jgi:hypothetical protein